MQSRPNTRGAAVPEYDAISQTSGAYIGKRSTNRPNRLASASASKTIKLTPNARTFYPDGYYKRVGYQKSEAGTSSQARVDALGQRVRDRFNEDGTSSQAGMKRNSVGGLRHRTLKQLKQADGNAGGPASQASRQSAAFSVSKRKSVVVTSNAGKQKKDLDDISVITADRLRKFNDAQGTVAGNIIDELAAKEAATAGESGEQEPAPDQGEEQNAEEDPDLDREEEKDEVHS